MSLDDKFRSAVNVINGLPKYGPYQPSNEMKLSFYAYYKQAIEGPISDPKPWTWEVVKKAKWDAWNRLGNMSKEEAMRMYVEELNKIVETMSFTENVADFLKRMDDFDAQNSDNANGGLSEEVSKSLIHSSTPKGSPKISSEMKSNFKGESMFEDEDEFYTDSIDVIAGNDSTQTPNGEVVSAYGCANQDNLEYQENTTDILMKTVLTLRTELNEISVSLRKIEQKQKLSRKKSLFKGLSYQSISFIILWPIFANLILLWFLRRRLHSR